MRRELIATVGSDEVPVVLETDESGRFRASFNGRTLEIDARLVRPGTWSLIIEGRSYVVDLDERASGLAVLAGTTETLLRVEDARRKRLAGAVSRKKAGGSGEEIKAPIAGKVVKILVAAGDVVAAGQGVAVLEAMKMENEIKADRGGTVQTIHRQPGQSVETLDPLVTLV
jgi:biotin carboxyl carrier protein